MAVLLPAVAAAATAVAADAQVCAGFPTASGETTLGGSMHFPEEVEQWGVEVSSNSPGPMAFFAGVSVVTLEGEDESQNVFAAGAAYELPAGYAEPGFATQLCPVAGVGFSRAKYVGSTTSLTLGLGAGATLNAGSGATFHPHLVPQVVFARFQSDDSLLEDASDTNFAVTGGVLVASGVFWAGPVASYVFGNGAEPVFGIRAGTRL